MAACHTFERTAALVQALILCKLSAHQRVRRAAQRELSQKCCALRTVVRICHDRRLAEQLRADKAAKRDKMYQVLLGRSAAVQIQRVFRGFCGRQEFLRVKRYRRIETADHRVKLGRLVLKAWRTFTARKEVHFRRLLLHEEQGRQLQTSIKIASARRVAAFMRMAVYRRAYLRFCAARVKELERARTP